MRLLATLFAMPLLACSNGTAAGDGAAPGSGAGDTRTYQVADFTGIALSGGDDVDVRVGTGFSVRAEGTAAALDHLKIERVGNTLRIGRDRSSFDWRGRSAKVFVTMPRIVAAATAGSGTIAIDRAEGTDFAANVAGSGTIAVDTLAVEQARFDLAGSGGARAGGTARSVRVSVAGSGDFAGSGLRARSAEVSVAGSGSVLLAVDGAASVSLVGSGNVDLGPNARCTVRRAGSGEVRCGGR